MRTVRSLKWKTKSFKKEKTQSDLGFVYIVTASAPAVTRFVNWSNIVPEKCRPELK